MSPGYFNSLTIAASILAAGVTVPILGPALEAKFAPVIIPLDLTEAWRDSDGATWVEVRAEKFRHCLFLEQSFLLGNPGLYRRVYFSRPYTIPGGPRPLGKQSFGLYKFETQGAKPGDTIIGTIHYQCHALWTSVSVFGPWKIPEERR